MELAHASAAADRAAAAPFVGLPPVHHVGTPSPAVGEPLAGFHTPREAVLEGQPKGDGASPDLIDVLFNRMAGGNGGPTETPGTAEPRPGNGPGPGSQRAAAVPPQLAHSALRLTSIGCPPLRVEPLAASLAHTILQHRPTFSEYVESKGLNGSAKREAQTIARSLDLGTMEMGAGFLVSSAAEVLLRRLVSIALAAKMGNYRMASLLEELPGESALSELPDSLLKSLGERLKLEMKLEQLGSGKPG